MAQKNGGYFDPSAQCGDYRVILGTCGITGEQGKVISVLTHVIDFDLPDGSKDSCQIWNTYSAEGLQQMARALAEAPYPVQIPDGDGIRANLNYFWRAFYADGTEVRQWEKTEGGDVIEKNFSHLDVTRVVRFFLLPKDLQEGLPCYLWDREQGLLRAERWGGEFEAMTDSDGRPLPWPSVPCHLEWCFRPQITLMYDPAHAEGFPVHVRHELGWRVDTLHGDEFETWFLLAIEDESGDWQILKRTPEESPHLGTIPWPVAEAQMAEPEPKVIEGEARIVSVYG